MKQWSVNCGWRGIAALLAHGAVEAVDRQEGQGIGADIGAHLLEVVGRGEQLVLLGRVDAVEVRMGDRRQAMRKCTSRAPASRIMRTIFTEVVPRTRLSSTSTMRLPCDAGAVGRVLHAHAELAHRLGRLDEGAARRSGCG